MISDQGTVDVESINERGEALLRPINPYENAGDVNGKKGRV